jgi:hypothetical protein
MFEEFDIEREPTLAEVVRRTILNVLATCDGRTASEVLALTSRIRASKRVLGTLSEDQREVVAAVTELFTVEAQSLAAGSRFSLSDLPGLTNYDPRVQALVERVRTSTGEIHDAHATWQALVEAVQRDVARRRAIELVGVIDAKASVEDLMKVFRTLEPPTAQQAVSRQRPALTADSYLAAHAARTAGRGEMRFSSGLPTLDRAYTPNGSPVGLVGPGEVVVVMGPTGTGKSSFSYGITPALVRDLHAWGLNDALHVFFHTEEETVDKLKAFGVHPGMSNHDLAPNLVVDAIGTSRRRMVEVLYDTVIAGFERSRTTGRPIVEFIAHQVQVDYIGSISEHGENETQATTTTAELLLRGIAAWNPEEMAKFGGVEFREYAGMAWPDGMEAHRVAVVAYAQLVKLRDEEILYRPGPCICKAERERRCTPGQPRVCPPANRRVSPSDFVLLDDRDEPMWDVREGDLRLFNKNQMRGSGFIANNANAILVLHRSAPYGNPVLRRADGSSYLADTRARIVFDKARTGTSLQYAPMKFDSQQSGFRAQYYDALAERAISEGVLTEYDRRWYSTPGDPILPIRPNRSPLAATRY